MQKKPSTPSVNGFSLFELLIVVAILVIMSAVSIPYIYSYQALYRSEEQTLKIMDLIRETSQHALNRRRTFRFEIDLTDNAVLIIDENEADPDILLKSIPIEPAGVLRMQVAPSGGIGRPDPPNYPAAIFATDSIGHVKGSETVINHMVWAIRFRSDGSVVNDANLPVSATLFVYPSGSSASDTPTDKQQVRAMTIYGGSGAVRYWKYNGTAFSAN